MSSQVVRRVAPFAVAVVVLALIAGVWLVVRGGPPQGGAAGSDGFESSDPPRVLALTSWTPPLSDTADPRYHLAGDLPRAPAEAVVHQVLGSDIRAEELADALGFTGPPEQADGALVWRAGGDPSMLRVERSPGRPWTLGGVARACAAPGVPVAPTVPTPAASPVPPDEPKDPPLTRGRGGGIASCADGEPPEQVTRADALARVDDLFALLDLHDPSTSPPGPTVTVTVDPVIDELPTTGFGTVVSVGARRLDYGQGWLARTQRGRSYPLVDARTAYDELVHTPLPMPLIACPEPAPPRADTILCGGPITVTGAHLGLSLQWEEGDEPLLVPAWLFDVEGSPQTLVGLAVDRRYLKPGTPSPGTTVGPPTTIGGGS